MLRRRAARLLSGVTETKALANVVERGFDEHPGMFTKIALRVWSGAVR
jgi:hypothetical protein